MAHCILGPCRRFVRVTRCAWIGEVVFVRHGRCNEPECMGMNVSAGNALTFDLRHMTGDTLASGAAVFMMRVRFQRGLMRSVRRIRAMTVQADLVRGFDELRVVSRPMHIVAIEACDVRVSRL